jgi:uncharacterized membrane protein (UPF0127 family)
MQKLLVFIAAAFLFLLVSGCDAQGLPAGIVQPTPTVTTPQATPTPAWVPPTALVGTPIPGAEATLTAAPALPKETLTITNSRGERINMVVEVANTPASMQLGLMFRQSMPPDEGMLFDFGEDTTSGFWMQNTLLPLSIAFILADGTILDIKDMQPLDQTTISPSGPYRYALEANQGFFRTHNIAPGDKVTLPGSQSVVIPGMPRVGSR